MKIDDMKLEVVEFYRLAQKSQRICVSAKCWISLSESETETSPKETIAIGRRVLLFFFEFHDKAKNKILDV